LRRLGGALRHVEGRFAHIDAHVDGGCCSALGWLHWARPPSIPIVPALQIRARWPRHLFGLCRGARREDPGSRTVSPPTGVTASRATRNSPCLRTRYKGGMSRRVPRELERIYRLDKCVLADLTGPDASHTAIRVHKGRSRIGRHAVVPRDPPAYVQQHWRVKL